MARVLARSGAVWIGVSVLAVLLAFVTVGIGLALIGADPIAAFDQMAAAAIGSPFAISTTLVKTLPRLLAALGIAIALRAGLWNIGAEGQLYLGAAATAGIALYGPQLGFPLLIIVALVGGILAGAAWAFLPGVLRARRGMDHILSPRDFARFGLLYLRGGRWGDRQLLPREAVRRAVASPLPADLPRTAGKKADMLPGQRSIGGSNNQTDHHGSYSYLWWTNGVDREGKRNWPGVPADAYAALGHRVLADPPGLEFAGPLAGMLTALEAIPDDAWLLTAPCDCPRLPTDLARRLLAAAEPHGLAFARAAREHPTHALLHTRLRQPLRAHLAAAGRAVLGWMRSEDGLDRALLLALEETREIIEPEAAALAATRATPDDLARIRAALAAMEADQDDPQAAIAADKRFHLAILDATNNPILRSFRGAIDTILSAMFDFTVDVFAGNLANHAAVVEAIAAGEPERAHQAMRQVLGYTRGHMLSTPAPADGASLKTKTASGETP